MNDKELLELAAKAAGIEIMPMQIDNVTKQGDNRFIGYLTKADQWPRDWFDPLKDDGDALRLAVKCEIDFEFDYIDYDKIIAWFCLDYDKHDGLWCKVDEPIYNKDRYAATRRAIVRAAAEIGKTK